MAAIAVYAVTALLATILYYIWQRYTFLKRLPPGPWGVPFLGYLPWVDQNLYRMPRDLGAKYGPIFSLRLGQYYVVFLHSWDVTKEAFLKHAEVFHGRPQLFWMVFTNKGNGIVPTEGDPWKTIRRYTASSLRDFGMGKLSLEGKIHEEVQHMFERIDTHKGKPFRPDKIVANAICNVICSVLFGHRFDYEDPIFRNIIKAATDAFQVGQSAILNWLPWLNHFPPFNEQKKTLHRCSIPFFSYSNSAIKKAEDHLDSGLKPTNFVEALMDEVRQGGARADTLKEHCVYTINQLLLAANETTATTLEWALLLLINNPDVQKKMQDEIDRVVGHDRLPSWEDRTRLPFTEATMYELMRMANIVPVSLPHRTIEDITIRGYFIPKDTIVFSSMGCWGVNPEYFPDPLTFKPERFLTADGKVDYKKPMAPFGMGKRECVGEALAKMEMFDFLACLVQNYTFSSKPGQKLHYIDGADRDPGWTTHPEPYEIVAVRRS